MTTSSTSERQRQTATPRLAVIINGEPVETAAANLADLLVERDLVQAKVATALNGSFVKATRRAGMALKNGDRIEIVAPRQGG